VSSHMGVLGVKKRKDQALFEQIYERLQKGATLKEIAQELGVGYPRAYSTLYRRGLSLNNEGWAQKQRPRKDTPPAQEIIDCYNEGNSARQVSRLFNLSHQGVINILRQNNVTIRPHRKADKNDLS